jgi:hypothetical protein
MIAREYNAVVFLVGSGLVVLGAFASATGIEGHRIISQTGAFFVSLTSICLYMKKKRMNRHGLLSALFIVLAWLFLLGVVKGHWVSHFAFDSLSFGLLFAACIGNDKIIVDKLLKILTWVTPVATIVVLYNSLSMYSGASIQDRFADSTYSVSIIRANMMLLYPTLFLALHFFKTSRIIRYSLCLNLVLIFYAGYRTATREFFLVAIIATLMILFLFIYERRNSKSVLLYFSMIPMLVNLFTLSLIISDFYQDIYIVQRLFNVKDTSGYFEGKDYRIYETEVIFKQFSLLQKLTGDGFGASQNVGVFKNAVNGVSSVHLGFGHLILKGGIFFLSLVVSIVCYVIFCSFCIKDFALKMNSCWIILFLSQSFFMHTTFSINMPFLLFSVVLGQSLYQIKQRGFKLKV